METKRFQKNDSGFVCANCDKTVEKLSYTSRNHCPYCLHSVHIDNNPGDRQNECGGILMPVFCRIDAKKGYIIEFVCCKCGEKKHNKAAVDDNMELIIELTCRDNKYNQNRKNK